MRIFATLLMLATALAPPPQAGRQAEGAVLRLDDLVAEALSANPEIAAMRERLSALERRVQPAGALPDPVVGLTLNNFPAGSNPFDTGRFPMTQTQISLQQSFPPAGSRSLRAELARADTRIEGEAIREREVAVAAEAARAYHALYLAERGLDTVTRTETLLEDIIASARARYEAGEGSLQDLLDARLALARLRISRQRFAQQQSTGRARINVILNRRPDDPLASPPSKLAPTHLDLDFAAAMNAADELRPSLRALDLTVERSDAAIALERSLMRPGYGFRVAYGIRDGLADLWTAGFVIDLPLRRGEVQRNRVAEREAERNAALARLRAERNRTALAVRSALDEIARAEEQLRLLDEETVPLATLALETALSAYRAGRGGLDDVIEKQVLLLDLELEAENLATQRELAIIDLQAAIGRTPGSVTPSA